MRFRYALASATVLTGCVTDQPLNIKAEMEAYISCTHANAVRFASQPGDPYSLAVAAEASCPAEKVAMMRSLNRQRGAGFALNATDDLERRNVRANIATIVKIRSG